MSQVTAFEVKNRLFLYSTFTDFAPLTSQPTVLARRLLQRYSTLLRDPADYSRVRQSLTKRRICSPPVTSDSTVGFYESYILGVQAGKTLYSWFTPHDMAPLVTLTGEKVSKFRRAPPPFLVYAHAKLPTQ